jgi:hypothetical protein
MGNALVMAPLPIVGATASATILGAPTHVSNDYMGLVWRVGGDNPTLTVDMGGDVAVDTIGLLGILLPPPGAVLTVQAATAAQGSGFGGGAYWEAPAVALYGGSQRLVNGMGVSLWRADPATPPPVARYWRFKFSALGGQGIQISRVAIGKQLVLARNFKFGAGFGVRDFGQAEFSRRGNLLRRRGPKHRLLQLSFAAAFREEVEAAIGPLVEQVGNTETVLIVTDPDPDPMRERRTYFGVLVGNLGWIWRTASAHQWDVSLESLL